MTSPCRYDVLSPGEMQRLSFARLFYLQPKYAGASLCWCGCVHVSNVFMKSNGGAKEAGLNLRVRINRRDEQFRFETIASLALRRRGHCDVFFS